MKSINPEWAWKHFEPSERQPWNHQLASHLFRRAGFGSTYEETEFALANGLDKTIDRFFDHQISASYDTEMNKSARYLTTTGDVRALSSWWLLKMMQSPNPLLEKMTLFWHGHFATSGTKVTEVAAMLNQNALLRKHALGKFEPMVQGISSDVAMLTYLDSTQNRKTRPNENYARELLELFCVGLDKYSEKDIKEIARCFTGWEVRKVSGSSKFQFNPRQHDTGTKSIFGDSGNFGGKDAVQIVLKQPTASVFIAKKLVRFFVYDDDEISDELVAPLAKSFRESEFDIGLLVRKILSSNLFFSDKAIARKVRSPVELVIGMLRQFNAKANSTSLMDHLELLGQLPMFPPNVKGWDGGRKWLNASTILARANFMDGLSKLEQVTLRDGSFKDWAVKRDAPRTDEDLVTWINESMMAIDLTSSARKGLVEIAKSESNREQKIRKLVAAVGVIPAFHLN